MKATILIFLIQLCQRFFISDGWVEKEVIVTSFGNDDLFVNADVTAFICDENGNRQTNGDYLKIINNARNIFFVRATQPVYKNAQKATVKRATVSNVFFDLGQVASGASRIFAVVEGRTAREKNLPTHAEIIVKYYGSTHKSDASGKYAGAGQQNTTSDEQASTLGRQQASSGQSDLTDTPFDYTAYSDQRFATGNSYGFLNFSCPGQKIYYVTEVFAYNPTGAVAMQDNLLRAYLRFINQSTGKSYRFDDVIPSQINPCQLYFEQGNRPLTREEALEVRNEVTKPLERRQIQIKTIKVKF